MVDLSPTIQAKSNQLNADDLIGGPITIKITKVSTGSSEQPILINYENDNGKPFPPCKSMRRVLVQVWGANGAAYVGRSLTLYRDAAVTFGGAAVGGTRISHMSNIDKKIVMSLTASRANKRPFTVQPLVGAATAPVEDIEASKTKLSDAADEGMESFVSVWKTFTPSLQKKLVTYKDDLKAGMQEISTDTPAPAEAEEVEEEIPI